MTGAAHGGRGGPGRRAAAPDPDRRRLRHRAGGRPGSPSTARRSRPTPTAATCRFVSDPVVRGPAPADGGRRRSAGHRRRALRDRLARRLRGLRRGQSRPSRRPEQGAMAGSALPSLAAVRRGPGGDGRRALVGRPRRSPCWRSGAPARRCRSASRRPTAGSSPSATGRTEAPAARRPQRPGGAAGRRRGPAQHRCQRRVLLEHHRVLRALHRLPGPALRSARPLQEAPALGADARRRDRRRAAPARGPLRPARRRDLRADPAQRIIVSEYFDPTVGPGGTFCAIHLGPGTIDAREAQWAHTHVVGGAERRRSPRPLALTAGRWSPASARPSPATALRPARAAGLGAHARAVLVLAGRARRPRGSPGRCTPTARATAPSRGASSPGWSPSCARPSSTAATTRRSRRSSAARRRAHRAAGHRLPPRARRRRPRRQAAVRPPSITSPDPVTKAAASEAR